MNLVEEIEVERGGGLEVDDFCLILIEGNVVFGAQGALGPISPMTQGQRQCLPVAGTVRRHCGVQERNETSTQTQNSLQRSPKALGLKPKVGMTLSQN